MAFLARHDLWPTNRRPSRAAALKLSSQSGVIPGKDLQEKLATMEKWGFDAVELGGDIVGNEKKYEDAVKKTKLKVSAICWGSPQRRFGFRGGRANASTAVEALKRVAHLRRRRRLDRRDLRARLQRPDEARQPGDPQDSRRHAAGHRRARREGRHAVMMEPLNRKEAFFLRQVADAASIARDCKSPGIGVMGDFYHMFIEETSDLGAFISGGSRVHHVHLASRHHRILPGQDERQFVDGFRGLKWIGYQDYCSFECGVRGDPQVEIPKSMAFLRDQWAKASVGLAEGGFR